MDDVGRWELEIEASYTNELGQEVTYTKKIYFTIKDDPNRVIYHPEHVKEEEENEVYYIDEWLSDDTKIGAETWETLKYKAMDPFYTLTPEYIALPEEEKQKVIALIEAQEVQDKQVEGSSDSSDPTREKLDP